MNKYVKNFLHRGLLFGGFGPIVLGIVYAVLQSTLKDFSLSGTQVCLAIISTYMLAFVQAGASVFNQIESWSLLKSMFFHFFTLYLAYCLCYIANTWIPFKAEVLLIFSLIFIIGYFVVWATVLLCIKASAKKLNSKLS